MKENCNELIMEEVIRIDLFRSNECQLPMPVNVPNITQMSNVTLPTPILTVNYSGEDNAQGVIEQPPTLKVAEKYQAAGHIYQHDLQAAITDGQREVRESVTSLGGDDAYMVLTTVDGTRFLCYTLPNTTQIVVEEQLSSQRAATLKASMKSASGIILLTD